MLVPAARRVSEEGVHDPVADASQCDLGQIVVPAFFLVAESLCVLLNFEIDCGRVGCGMV